MPPTDPPAVVVRDLRKAYAGSVAVESVDLTVESGEIFALLGPNGAGKTTTVEICAGFRRADSGTVRVLGADPRRGDALWKSRIGIVPQHVDDLPDLTVHEAVESVAAMYPRSHPTDEVIELVGLQAKARSRCGRLSGGQRRRLDVALGIVGLPDLLFLDEPTTGFDPEARRDFWDLIEQLQDSGTTIVLTTHYLDEAERLADRVGVIAAGRVIDVGSPATIGGRDAAEATVAWTGPQGRESRRTADPTALVVELSAAFHGEVPGLVVQRPTLEDVYVRMIERANAERADSAAAHRHGAARAQP